MYRVLQLLDEREIAECRKIAAETPFIDGRISNPHNKAKNNQQLHDADAGQRSSQLLMQAFTRSPEFREFAFPLKIAPPLMTRYQPGMSYGAHADAAFIQIGSTLIRSDLSCTVFLNGPASYEGGALHVRLGDSSLRFKLQPGEAIIYPSDTFHEVEPVTKGERPGPRGAARRFSRRIAFWLFARNRISSILRTTPSTSTTCATCQPSLRSILRRASSPRTTAPTFRFDTA